MREEQKEKEREEPVKKRTYGRGVGCGGGKGRVLLPAAPHDPAGLKSLVWLPSETLLLLSTLLQIS